MTRSERLIAILQHLRDQRRPVTAGVLAERFAVSERTIYRDVATLASRGAVIEGEAGVGYVLREGYFLPPLSFDAPEAAALMLGLRFVLRRGDPDLIEAATSARGKLAAALPALFGEPAALSSPLVVPPAPGDGTRILGSVRAALAGERKLRLRYADASGTETRRTVWPLLIGWFDEAEVLTAWCEMRVSFRHFRIDRIQDADVVDERPARSRRSLLAEYRQIEPGIAL